MKNRYDDTLRLRNQEIIDLCPYNPIFFIEAAKVISRIEKEDLKILEIGSGEGDSALPILSRTKVHLDLLDISQEMNKIAEKKLETYKDRTSFICEDANEYISRSEPYDVIFAAWTIHNFKQEDKRKLFETIYKNLVPDGILLLLDKVYPAGDRKKLLEHQNDRYRKFMDEELASAIIAHEMEDITDDYRMDEGTLLESLNASGFSKAEILDRIERDVILVATK